MSILYYLSVPIQIEILKNPHVDRFDGVSYLDLDELEFLSVGFLFY